MHTVRRHALALAALAFAGGCTREAPSSSPAPAPPTSQAAQPTTMTLSAAVPATVAAARPSGGGVALGAGAVSVHRPIPAGTGSIYLVLQGLGADAPPGIIFNVYVDDAPTSARIDEAHHATTINFYDYKMNRSSSDDVTQLVGPTLTSGKTEVVITFVPVDGPPAAGSHARIDDVKLVRQ